MTKRPRASAIPPINALPYPLFGIAITRAPLELAISREPSELPLSARITSPRICLLWIHRTAFSTQVPTVSASLRHGMTIETSIPVPMETGSTVASSGSERTIGATCNALLSSSIRVAIDLKVVQRKRSFVERTSRPFALTANQGVPRRRLRTLRSSRHSHGCFGYFAQPRNLFTKEDEELLYASTPPYGSEAQPERISS